MATQTVRAGENHDVNRGTITRGASAVIRIRIKYQDDPAYDFTGSQCTAVVVVTRPSGVSNIAITDLLSTTDNVAGEYLIELDPMFEASGTDLWDRLATAEHFEIVFYIAVADAGAPGGYRPLHESKLRYRILENEAPIP